MSVSRKNNLIGPFAAPHKITTESLQRKTTMKKRTPPAAIPNFCVIRCGASYKFQSPARPPNPRASVLKNMKIKEQTHFIRSLNFPAIRCYTYGFPHYWHAGKRPEIFIKQSQTSPSPWLPYGSLSFRWLRFFGLRLNPLPYNELQKSSAQHIIITLAPASIDFGASHPAETAPHCRRLHYITPCRIGNNYGTV